MKTVESKVTKKKIEKVAIKVEGLSKTFKIPHEKQSTLKGTAVNLLNSKAKGYEIFHALDDVNFEVKKGEFFGIIGRNGSGKSTLLKILAGIYIPDKGKGKITIDGKLSPFLELGVGFNAELTGRENIFLGGTILGLTRKQIAEKYDKIVAFSELEEFIDMKLKNYSSGMQVRLAFSLSINVEAEILLMDEVLAVGDTNFQSKCLTEFNKYKEQGKTVILVTHDVAVVQRYCDRALLLRSGKIEKIGKADEVADEYRYQNMSDEERRMVDEQNQGAKDETDTKKKLLKVAEITKVEFLDKNENKKSVFETGEDLSVRIYFKQNKKTDQLNFGMTITSQENAHLIGISTIIDKVDVSKFVKEGYFQAEYKKLPLRTGTYYIDAAIFGKNHDNVFDYISKVKQFKVFSKGQNDGLVELDYRWTDED